MLVVPSLWDEPFGRVCIEAFAHGVPVVAARSGALPEIVEVGKSGLTFRAGDDRGLAGCLRTLAQDRALLARVQAGAIERCRHYSPERLGLAFEEFLGEFPGKLRRARKFRAATASPSTERPLYSTGHFGDCHLIDRNTKQPLDDDVAACKGPVEIVEGRPSPFKRQNECADHRCGRAHVDAVQ